METSEVQVQRAIYAAQAGLPGHDSPEEQPGSECLPKYPKPIKRPRNDTRSIRARSQAQERELARSARRAGFKAARRVPGSGALAGLPADVDYGEWLLGEAKETRSGRLVIDPEWIDKIANQAKQIARPWWVLHAWAADSTSNYRKVAILDESHFFDIIGRLKAHEDGD